MPAPREEVDLRYTVSDKTLPIIEYTDPENVTAELQDTMNDFIFKVFFSKNSAVQQLLVMQEDKSNTQALVSKDAAEAVEELRMIYPESSDLRVSRVDASFIGGSELAIYVELSASDDADDPIIISHSFSTVVGM